LDFHISEINRGKNRRQAGLRIKASKCDFPTAKVDYLGHTLAWVKSHHAMPMWSLSTHQRNYSVVEKEALALILATRTFSVYLNANVVTVYSDCNSIAQNGKPQSKTVEVGIRLATVFFEH